MDSTGNTVQKAVNSGNAYLPASYPTRKPTVKLQPARGRKGPVQ